MPSRTRLVDYTLAKRATLKDVRRGRVSRREVCDAHPDLVRAARNVGEPTDAPCPICAQPSLAHVTYVFGDALRLASGRTWPRDGLRRLQAEVDECACFVVEVCTACSWNHLVQRFLVGRRHAG